MNVIGTLVTQLGVKHVQVDVGLSECMEVAGGDLLKAN